MIIPAFNAEGYLPEALASVSRQTYDDWEVVVADDASIDATAVVAEGFGRRFKVLRTSVNGGPSVARNRAIAAASGDLLAFLDADDFWLPGYLSDQVALYDGNGGHRGDVGLVTCDARILGEDGYRAETYMDVVGSPHDLTLVQLLRFNSIFTSVLSPCVVVEAAGGFEAALRAGEDYDLWLRVVELGYRVVANRRALAVYRLTPGSASSRPELMARGLQLAYTRALERGNLSPAQRRVARRSRRLNRAVEESASISADRAVGRVRRRRIARFLPLRLLVFMENPHRWHEYARRAAGSISSAFDRQTI